MNIQTGTMLVTHREHLYLATTSSTMSNSFNLDLFRKTYQGPTVRVKLVAAENAAAYLPAIPFTSSKDVWDYFSALEDEPREVVIATYLDNKHHVLSIEEVSRGTLTASLFEP